MAKKANEPVLAATNLFGQEVLFSEYDDVVKKVRSIVSEWANFFGTLHQNQVDTKLDQAIGLIRIYELLDSSLAAYGRANSELELKALAKHLGEWIAYSEPVFEPESMFARALKSVSKDGFTENALGIVVQLALDGKVPASRFDHGNVFAVAAYLGKLERFRLEAEYNPKFVDQFDVAAGEFKTLKEQATTWFLDAKSAHDERISTFNKAVVKTMEDYEKKSSETSKILEDSASRAKSMADALEQKHQLQQPTKFWRDKRDKHQKYRWVYGSVAAAWFLFGSIVMVCLLTSAWPNLNSTIPKDEVLNMWPILMVFGKGLLLVSLYLWIARILVRLFLSEVHLAMDADQRITMTESYLAMVGEGSLGTEPEYASKILEALFRPTQDGIVKDDASSDPIMSAIWQRIGRG